MVDKEDKVLLSIIAFAVVVWSVFDVAYYWRVVTYLVYKSQESLVDGYIERQNSFEPSDLNVDLSGKVFMVTGATGVIGRYLSLEFAKRGGEVHMVCRNMKLCKTLKDEFVPESGNDDIHCHHVDLSLIENTHEFTTSFLSREPKLDVLVHAAGAFNPDRNISVENTDPDFIVNVMSNYLLTSSLLPALRQSREPRVIVVSSGSGLIYNLKWNDTDFEYAKHYSTATFFAQKRQQIEVTSLMANITPSIHYSSVDPGWVDTGIMRKFPILYFLLRQRLRTAVEGADTALWLAISEQGLYYESGRFYMDRKPISKELPRGLYRDMERARKALLNSLIDISQQWHHAIVPPENFDEP